MKPDTEHVKLPAPIRIYMPVFALCNMLYSPPMEGRVQFSIQLRQMYTNFLACMPNVMVSGIYKILKALETVMCLLVLHVDINLEQSMHPLGPFGLPDSWDHPWSCSEFLHSSPCRSWFEDVTSCIHYVHTPCAIVRVDISYNVTLCLGQMSCMEIWIQICCKFYPFALPKVKSTADPHENM